MNIQELKNFNKWLSLPGIIIVFLLVSGCGLDKPQTDLVYENTELGFALEFPKNWQDEYLVEDFQGGINVFVREVNENESRGGLLFTVERRIGELITAADIAQAPVQEEILLQGNGYTYLVRLPSDVQYLLADDYLSAQYKKMAAESLAVARSIFLIGEERPPVNQDGFKVVGSSFFTLEIPKTWECRVEEGLSWGLYVDNHWLGRVEMVPYYTPLDGRFSVSDKEIRRKIFLTFNQEKVAKDIAAKIGASLVLQKKDSPFTVVDLQSDGEEYMQRGGRKILGRVFDLIHDDDRITSIRVQRMDLLLDESQPNGFRIEEISEIVTYDLLNYGVQVIPLTAPNYNTYGIYEMPLAEIYFAENDPSYRDSYYDFVVSADGKLKVIQEQYLP